MFNQLKRQNVVRGVTIPEPPAEHFTTKSNTYRKIVIDRNKAFYEAQQRGASEDEIIEATRAAGWDYSRKSISAAITAHKKHTGIPLSRGPLKEKPVDDTERDTVENSPVTDDFALAIAERIADFINRQVARQSTGLKDNDEELIILREKAAKYDALKGMLQ